MKKYKVYDNDDPACILTSSNPMWHSNEFDTFEMAKSYLEHWLGINAQCVPISKMSIGKEYLYNGLDTVKILYI